MRVSPLRLSVTPRSPWCSLALAAFGAGLVATVAVTAVVLVHGAHLSPLFNRADVARLGEGQCKVLAEALRLTPYRCTSCRGLRLTARPCTLAAP